MIKYIAVLAVGVALSFQVLAASHCKMVCVTTPWGQSCHKECS